MPRPWCASNSRCHQPHAIYPLRKRRRSSTSSSAAMKKSSSNRRCAFASIGTLNSSICHAMCLIASFLLLLLLPTVSPASGASYTLEEASLWTANPPAELRGATYMGDLSLSVSGTLFSSNTTRIAQALEALNLHTVDGSLTVAISGAQQLPELTFYHLRAVTASLVVNVSASQVDAVSLPLLASVGETLEISIGDDASVTTMAFSALAPNGLIAGAITCEGMNDGSTLQYLHFHRLRYVGPFVVGEYASVDGVFNGRADTVVSLSGTLNYQEITFNRGDALSSSFAFQAIDAMQAATPVAQPSLVIDGLVTVWFDSGATSPNRAIVFAGVTALGPVDRRLGDHRVYNCGGCMLSISAPANSVFSTRSFDSRIQLISLTRLGSVIGSKSSFDRKFFLWPNGDYAFDVNGERLSETFDAHVVDQVPNGYLGYEDSNNKIQCLFGCGLSHTMDICVPMASANVSVPGEQAPLLFTLANASSPVSYTAMTASYLYEAVSAVDDRVWALYRTPLPSGARSLVAKSSLSPFTGSAPRVLNWILTSDEASLGAVSVDLISPKVVETTTTTSSTTTMLTVEAATMNTTTPSPPADALPAATITAIAVTVSGFFIIVIAIVVVLIGSGAKRAKWFSSRTPSLHDGEDTRFDPVLRIEEEEHNPHKRCKERIITANPNNPLFSLQHASLLFSDAPSTDLLEQQHQHQQQQSQAVATCVNAPMNTLASLPDDSPPNPNLFHLTSADKDVIVPVAKSSVSSDSSSRAPLTSTPSHASSSSANTGQKALLAEAALSPPLTATNPASAALLLSALDGVVDDILRLRPDDYHLCMVQDKSEGSEGYSLLHAAVLCDSEAHALLMVRHILAIVNPAIHDTLVGLTDADGRTPIHLAAVRGSIPILETLVLSSRGGDAAGPVAICDCAGDTCLIAAMKFAQPQSVRWLLSHAPSVELIPDSKRWFAAEWAVLLADTSMVEAVFLDRNAHYSTSSDLNVMHLLAKCTDPTITELVLCSFRGQLKDLLCAQTLSGVDAIDIAEEGNNTLFLDLLHKQNPKLLTKLLEDKVATRKRIRDQRERAWAKQNKKNKKSGGKGPGKGVSESMSASPKSDEGATLVHGDAQPLQVVVGGLVAPPDLASKPSSGTGSWSKNSPATEGLDGDSLPLGDQEAVLPHLSSRESLLSSIDLRHDLVKVEDVLPAFTFDDVMPLDTSDFGFSRDEGDSQPATSTGSRSNPASKTGSQKSMPGLEKPGPVSAISVKSTSSSTSSTSVSSTGSAKNSTACSSTSSSTKKKGANAKDGTNDAKGGDRRDRRTYHKKYRLKQMAVDEQLQARVDALTTAYSSLRAVDDGLTNDLVALQQALL